LVSTDLDPGRLAPVPTAAPLTAPQRRQRWTAREIWATYRLMVIVGAVLVCLVVLPVVRMVWSSFQQNPPLDTTVTLSNYVDAYTSSTTTTTAGRSSRSGAYLSRNLIRLTLWPRAC